MAAVASPPRGAPLRALNPFGGATTTAPGATTGCRNYLWTFLVLLGVWAVLVLFKPSFIKNENGTINYQRVFWITLMTAVAIVLGLCWWSRQGAF